MSMLTILLLAFAAGPGQAAAAATPAPVKAEVNDPSGYSYDAEGRRDPFVSLVGRGTDDKASGPHAAGTPGFLVNDVTVKGVIQGRAGYIAMIQGPDNKTYIVRSGDRLLDGAVKTITQDGVVFSQDVNDPLSIVKQREVPKRVRAADGRG